MRETAMKSVLNRRVHCVILSVLCTRVSTVQTAVRVTVRKSKRFIGGDGLVRFGVYFVYRRL